MLTTGRFIVSLSGDVRVCISVCMLCFFYIEYFCHVSSEGHLVQWLVQLKLLPSQNNV